MFCAVLAWSRYRFVPFAQDQRRETTLRLLAECLEELGGVPAVVLTDRMACLRAAAVANQVVPHPEYVRFAAHYGFRHDFGEAADPESRVWSCTWPAMGSGTWWYPRRGSEVTGASQPGSGALGPGGERQGAQRDSGAARPHPRLFVLGPPGHPPSRGFGRRTPARWPAVGAPPQPQTGAAERIRPPEPPAGREFSFVVLPRLPEPAAQPPIRSMPGPRARAGEQDGAADAVEVGVGEEGAVAPGLRYPPRPRAARTGPAPPPVIGRPAPSR
jgi:hypothetical protein